MVKSPRVFPDLFRYGSTGLLAVKRPEKSSLLAGVALERFRVYDMFIPDLPHGFDHIGRDIRMDPDTEIIQRVMEVRQPIGNGRDRAITFNFERLGSEHRKRTQTVSAYHLHLFGRELRSGVGFPSHRSD